jgi:hypothetical protein
MIVKRFCLKMDSIYKTTKLVSDKSDHGLRTPGEEIAFIARPKTHSHSQIFRYGRSIFCPKFLCLCLHWVSVVHESDHCSLRHNKIQNIRLKLKSTILISLKKRTLYSITNVMVKAPSAEALLILLVVYT